MPLFLLNLKTYPAVLGAGAVRIAAQLESAGRAAGVPVAVAPALPDVGLVAAAVGIPVLAQSVDPVDAGARTGSVPPEALVAAGASGSLVNHSERPINTAEVGRAVRRLADLGLVSVVCAPSTRDARRLARFRPGYLAIEPPELIGGQHAVSTTRPELIEEAAEAVGAVSPWTQLLCGAGIHRKQDVQRALELGSRGVLVASAVTKAPNPRAVLAELLAGF